MTNAVYCAADEHFDARRKNVFCIIGQNTFFLLYYNDECFSTENNALKAHVQTSALQIYTCSYQQFSSTAFLEIGTHRHSPSKAGGNHALVLTSK